MIKAAPHATRAALPQKRKAVLKMDEKSKVPRYRIGIVIIICLVILAVTFAAYMLNTGLEETLISERGESIITHDHTYDSSAAE